MLELTNFIAGKNLFFFIKTFTETNKLFDKGQDTMLW